MARIPLRNFSERNPVTIAVVGLVVLVLLLFAIFNSRNLPIVGDGATYSADFTESAGLREGDEVAVAGVRVGSVSSVELEGGHVRVQFRVKDAWLGDQSTAAIKIRTLLGAKYLSIDPLGNGELRRGDTIPLERTTAPFDITDAFSQLSDTVQQIDTDQLGKSFETLAQAFADTPDTVRATLTGLTSLSKTISSRDAQLGQLLTAARSVSKTLVQRNTQIGTLVDSGDALLTELQDRNESLRQLLQGTVALAQQVQGLVADNNQTLAPALASLRQLAGTLQQNQANLQKAVALIGPYYSTLNDALGNGRWLDTYICGLFDPTTGNTPVLDPDQPRDCAPRAGGS